MVSSRKIRVRLRGFDSVLLDKNMSSLVELLKNIDCSISGPIPLPTKIRKYTVLRSPHVNKESREQFEMRTHKRILDILNPSPEVMSTLMKVELSTSIGVDIEQ